MDKNSKNNIIAGIVLLAIIGVMTGVIPIGHKQAALNPALTGQKLTDACFGDKPNASVSAVDKFAQVNHVLGTDYVKANGRAYAVASGNVYEALGASYEAVYGDQLSFWHSNTSFECEPVTGTARCGKLDLQFLCYQNATGLSLSVNSVKDGTLGTVETALGTNAGAGSNITIGANGNSKVKVVLNTVAKKSYLPMGGCVAVEYPNTLTQVDVTGDISQPCPYTWAYSVHSTSNTFKLYEVPKGFDAFTTAQMKTFYADFTAGSSNPSGDIYFNFQPAKYYLTDAGELALGIQKDKNLDTTLTGEEYGLYITLK